MKKVTTIVIILLSSFCYSQKTMIERLKPNHSLTIHIQYYGDVFSDPRNFFTIQLTKLDSNSYELLYKKGDKEIKKSGNHYDLLPLINLEKECINAKRELCLSYTIVNIKLGWRQKSYRMNRQFYRKTLKELGLE
jgi:hypothetical protein